jgi:hypothetical protein
MFVVVFFGGGGGWVGWWMTACELIFFDFVSSWLQ